MRAVIHYDAIKDDTTITVDDEIYLSKTHNSYKDGDFKLITENQSND